jgi:hypothetical protein
MERELYAILERLKDFSAVQRELQTDSANTISRR